MRLIAFELEGYRKFRSAKLEVDGALTAIVGPNEAGKTSLLTALTRQDDDEPIDRRDRARTMPVSENDIVLSALYLVESDDRQALMGLNGADDPANARWLIVRKFAAGNRSLELLVALQRDWRPRARAAARLETFLRHTSWPPGSFDDDHPFGEDALAKVTQALVSERRDLADDELEAISRLADELSSRSGRSGNIAQELETAHQLESTPHPNDVALERLQSRIPRYLFFSERDRDLRTDYNLAEVVGDQEQYLAEVPPRALENLALLGGLNLSDVRKAIADDDSPRVRGLLDAANASLREALASWSQEEITAEFEHVGNQILRIHVRDETGNLSVLDERSDGIKIFLSLLAATARGGSGHPTIALIDELERHLHYDAQADVVQVLARQRFHKQVIYTTHSAGCLPEDLGSGVRLVQPEPTRNASQVENRFWSQGTGFSPLLLGMGANTLAFVPVRNAVLTEGGSDVVLLPTLLREATGLSALGFQIAPAASNAPAAHIAGLELEAPTVVWLVDGDEAGRNIRSRLQNDHKIAPHRIKVLGGGRSPKMLEDLLLPSVYAGAINLEFERSGRAARISERDLPDVNRPGFLSTWCEREGVKSPNKVAVANRVLDLRRDTEARVATDRLLSADGHRRLAKLHTAITAEFSRP